MLVLFYFSICIEDDDDSDDDDNDDNTHAWLQRHLRLLKYAGQVSHRKLRLPPITGPYSHYPDGYTLDVIVVHQQESSYSVRCIR